MLETTEKSNYYNKIESIFDNLAVEKNGYYDANENTKKQTHTIWQRIIRKKIISILKKLTKNYKVERILDVGCGMGDFTNELQSKFNFKAVHGIDFSDSMLKIASKKHQENEAISFSQEDVTKKMSFNNNSFDLALCLNMLHHVLLEDQGKAIDEFCRISKKYVIVEIKRIHPIWKYIFNDKVLGYLTFYPNKISTITEYFRKNGFELQIKRPIFIWMLPSPIVILVFKKQSN